MMIEHSRPTIGKEEEEAAVQVIRTAYLAEGKFVRRFEDELSGYIGAKGGVAVSTGTLALHLALVALGAGRGDEIIAPSYVCRSVLNAILYAGATPVLCDCNREDYNISFDAARRRVTRRTKAVIVPHMFGCPAQIDKFRQLGIYVIEDCAHSIGSEYKGRKTGSWGDLSVFSFEGTKYIVTGEGGMVTANSRNLLKRLKGLKEPDSRGPGIKHTYRMTDLQAAIGIAQLAKLESFIARRRKIAGIYVQSFRDLEIELPQASPGALHTFHRFMIKTRLDIAGFMKKCLKSGVKVKQPVKPLPLHRYLKLPRKDFPNTEYIMRSSVSIPIYPSLIDKEIKLITAAVRHGLNK